MDDNAKLQSTRKIEDNLAETRRVWFTPQVSESPINELTQAAPRSIGESDAGFYS